MDFHKSVKEIFIISQRTAGVHQKNAIVLKKYYEREPEECWKSLKNMINIIITTEKYSQYVDRIMDFLGYFCSLLIPISSTESNENNNEFVDHPLLSDIISYLINTSESSKDTIRLRSCQLVIKVMNNLVGMDVSQDLCEKLEEALLIRLEDSKSVIKQQAVISLHRLQDPTNPEDIIIPSFLHTMNSDFCAKVRQVCIEKVAPRKDAIKGFIRRIRDIDVNVKLAAYKRLASLPKFLKISEKGYILHCSLTDESDKVREILPSLISSWLNHYDNNVLKLMKSLRMEADEKDIEFTTILFQKALDVIFKNKTVEELSSILPLNEKRLIPFEELDWELSSYWRIYLEFLSNKNGDHFGEEYLKVVPELTHFSKYIKEYCASRPNDITGVDFLKQQYIFKQLFLITRTCDYSDPTNRQCLNKLISYVLENATFTSDVTDIVIGNLEYSIPHIDKRTQFVTEIISDILCPMNSDEYQRLQQEKEYEISKLRVKLNCLHEEQVEFIRQQDFVEAERLKNEINDVSTRLAELKSEPIVIKREEKKTDVITRLKGLDIAAAVLVSPQVTVLNPPLKSLKESFIQELLINENDNVRVKAYRCYALCGIVNKETSATGIHIFSTPIFAYQNGEECDTQTLLICIGAVTDLLRIYGSKLMAACETEELSESTDEKHQVVFAGGTSLTDVLQGLADLMDDEQTVIQERAALGLCQLILSDRIISPSLIGRLIIKWCNPVSEDEKGNRIKQIIGFTLEEIARMPQCVEQLQEAVLITVKALHSAPRTSPLADVNIENIAKFVLALCKICPEGYIIHVNLAKIICCEIRNKPRNRLNIILSKMLLMLAIPDDKMLVTELLNICDQIRDNIHERQILNNIMKFTTMLKTKDGAACSTFIKEVDPEDV